MFYVNHNNVANTLEKLIERIIEINNEKDLKGHLENNYLMFLMYIECLSKRSEYHKEIENILKSKNGECLMKEIFPNLLSTTFFDNLNTEKFSQKGNFEYNKIHFILEEFYNIFQKDLDGSYGLIKLVKNIKLSDNFEKYADFSYKVIKEKWPLKLETDSTVILFDNNKQISAQLTDLIISSNKLEVLFLSPYNYKHVLKELEIINYVLKQTELYLKEKNFSYKINLSVKKSLFKELKIMKLYQAVEKRMLANNVTSEEINILKDISTKISQDFKEELNKINKKVLVENELIIKKTVAVKDVQTLVFNKFKQYNLNYNKSILFRDMVYFIGEDIILEQKCYNKNVVKINVTFKKEISNKIKEDFMVGIETIMHDLKKMQLGSVYVSDNTIVKQMESRLDELLRTVTLIKKIEDHDIEKKLKERKKV